MGQMQGWWAPDTLFSTPGLRRSSRSEAYKGYVRHAACFCVVTRLRNALCTEEVSDVEAGLPLSNQRRPAARLVVASNAQ